MLGIPETTRSPDGAQVGMGTIAAVGAGVLLLEELEQAMVALEQAEGLLDRT